MLDVIDAFDRTRPPGNWNSTGTRPIEVLDKTSYRIQVMTNLGALDGAACSGGWGINSKTQIGGVSAKTCTFTAEDRRAFLWEKRPNDRLESISPSRSGPTTTHRCLQH